MDIILFIFTTVIFILLIILSFDYLFDDIFGTIGLLKKLKKKSPISLPKPNMELIKKMLKYRPSPLDWWGK